MNRDYPHRSHRDPRFSEQDRYGGRSSRYDDPSRYEESASNWNDAQTARWLSHYGGGRHNERDYDDNQRADYDRTEYGRGYGSNREQESPRYGQRYQETWEGHTMEEPWRQRGAERISPGMHGRYGRRGEDDDQGYLNFQPGERGYGSVYGPTFGSTYRHPERGYEGWTRDQDWLGSGQPNQRQRGDERSGAFFGKGPSGYTRSDERIREDVCDRLTDDPYVDAGAIQVSVEAGVVTLQGQVSERQMKHRAEDCAEHVSGVKDVENRLRVSRDAWSEDKEGGSPLLRK